MSASVLSRPCICWPTLVSRFATSCLLGACFCICSIWRWMSESCDCRPSMSFVETHPVTASAATRQPARGMKRWRFMSADVRLAGDDHVDAAVLRPAALLVGVADGALLAVREGAQAGARDSQRAQVVAHRVGAPLAQGQVVLVGAPRVGMPLEGHRELRALQQVGVARQLVAGVVR